MGKENGVREDANQPDNPTTSTASAPMTTRMMLHSAKAPVGFRQVRGLRTRLNTRRGDLQQVRAENPETFPRNWLKRDNFPFWVGYLAWTIPSCIPVGSYGGESLFYRMNESIASNLANFPTGPGVADPFWVYMLTWHIGLFLTLTLAKIGYEGKKEGYFGSNVDYFKKEYGKEWDK